ncbi:MAG: hypothetical protein CM1200mP25_4670 [Acidobacteriota bacterium]|nr:MAG: hypothetical protein CM1200mP25_4670 [Acidobacteriota bacterium]
MSSRLGFERTDGGGSYSAATEDDGEYIILGLQSGTYEITFTLDGYQGVRVAENVRSSAGPRLDVELEALASGGRLRGEQDFEAEGGSPKNLNLKKTVSLSLKMPRGKKVRGRTVSLNSVRSSSFEITMVMTTSTQFLNRSW